MNTVDSDSCDVHYRTLRSYRIKKLIFIYGYIDKRTFAKVLYHKLLVCVAGGVSQPRSFLLQRAFRATVGAISNQRRMRVWHSTDRDLSTVFGRRGF